MRERNGFTRGFTLMEILIAMAVFLIGVIAIIAVFPRGLKSSQESQNDSICATFIESLADAITDAVHRQNEDAEKPNNANGFQIRIFHDGLHPTDGAYLRLPVPWDDDGVADAGPDPAVATDDSPKIPDYLSPGPVAVPPNWGGGSNPKPVVWLAPPANPQTDLENVSQEQVMDNRGWWCPGGVQPPSLGVTNNPRDATPPPNLNIIYYDSTVSPAPDVAAGMDAAAANWAANAGNSGCAVFRMGTMTVAGVGGGAAQATIEGGERGALHGAGSSGMLASDYVDPLKRYYFNIKVEVDNRFTPMTSPHPADGAEAAPNDRLERYNLDDSGGIDASDFRRAYFPGLFRFTVYIYRDWNPGMTRNYAERERNKLHVFQFLAAGTQGDW
ncbi:MAG: prepilin-type N-terminal cleavage/methylation domain-containing protein [Planctomycetes bacterium]|nr:prepilin-type N-terminal cleavage/methylation domain-containing protein [Planctomycetota bacterium]